MSNKRKEKLWKKVPCFPLQHSLTIVQQALLFAFSVYPLKDTLSSDLKADSFNDEAFETGK